MGDSSQKRKKSYYFNPKKRKEYNLEPGLKGFLCFCNFREKDCLREAMNLLEEYNNKLTSITSNATHETKKSEINEASSDDEIEDALSKEIEEVKNITSRKKLFQVVESGAKNILFIRSTVDDPVKIAYSIIRHIAETKEQKTRFLLRLIPVEKTCKANLHDIKENIDVLVEKYFNDESKTFSVVYNHRNNNSLNRDEVIKEIAAIVDSKNKTHSVNLKQPQLAIIVEVIRGMCLLSVVPDYIKFKKYNLHQLCEKAVSEKIQQSEDISLKKENMEDQVIINQ